MINIPISFDYQGKHYSGSFDFVHGAGTNVFHLMINKYYYGRLRMCNDNWVFDSTRFGMEEMATFFGNYITKATTNERNNLNIL